MTLSGKFRGKYHLLQSIQSGLGLGLDRGDNIPLEESFGGENKNSKQQGYNSRCSTQIRDFKRLLVSDCLAEYILFYV